MIEHGDFRITLEADGSLTIACASREADDGRGHEAIGYRYGNEEGRVQAEAFELRRVQTPPGKPKDGRISVSRGFWQDGFEYTEHDRVELHPATDAWMQGDRFGEIVFIGRKYVHVKMDWSGRTLKLLPRNIGSKVEGDSDGKQV